MKTRAVRLYGENDLRLEEFELPEIKDDEILGRVISDSMCMSSYKAAIQGGRHKRVPDNVAENPVIIGHEFCGEIISVGKKWADKFKPGEKFVIQPALNYKGSMAAPGYSYSYIGGDATYVVIPNEVMEMDCLLSYNGEGYFGGSLAEPLSCVTGAFHAMYHVTRGRYVHDMGIRPGGNMIILGGTGPMGLAAVDYIMNCERRPGKLVVVGRNDEHIARAAGILSPETAKKSGMELCYINGKKYDDQKTELLKYAPKGYDDVLVFAPDPALVELADSITGEDGCLNFFAGPSDAGFSARYNFYNVHYAGTHVVGTSGGNTDDMREALEMMSRGLLNPAILVTHIGGLDCVPRTTLSLPHISGGKKLIYTGIDMPLTAIADFGELGKSDPMFKKLDDICKANNGLWCVEAEKYLLEVKAK